MTAAVQAQVEALMHLDLEGLRAVWARDWGPVPKLRSVDLLRYLLAWRIQAQALGGLDRDTRGVLARTGALAVEGQHLGVGARLTRSWKGRRIDVVVVENGFRWEDRTFASLSACATAIAGTRWNGPRFFGLREAAA